MSSNPVYLLQLILIFIKGNITSLIYLVLHINILLDHL